MSMTIHRDRLWQRIVALLVLCAFALAALMPAHADGPAAAAAGPPAASPGVKWKICDPVGFCFISKEAKEKHSNEHGCKFIEDVCEGPQADNKGANADDKPFWGDRLWQVVTKDNPVVYGYNFVKGLLTGLKDQLVDLWDFVTNIGDVMGGLAELGKAFYNDPKGTIALLGELLGNDAVDTLTRATRCGAYDLGKVIGSYVSPAVALKLATKLVKYGGKMDDAVKAVKRDFRCASFAASTLIYTASGLVSIDSIAVGQHVFSRSERTWADALQPVTQVFERTAPTHRRLRTEYETLRLTDEHPLWVQGQGWTEAKDVKEDDVIAAEQGDVLVRANDAVARPLKVHNFSVAHTSNYFAGAGGVWAHNAGCDLPNPYRAPPSPSNYEIGASDGGNGAWMEMPRPDTPNFRFEKQVTGAPNNIEYNVPVTGNTKGVNFDGYDAERGVLLDAKHYTDANPLVSPSTPLVVKESFTADLTAEARRQLAAANGSKIEWHVSNDKAADAIRVLFAQDASLKKITIIFTPDIVN